MCRRRSTRRIGRPKRCARSTGLMNLPTTAGRGRLVGPRRSRGDAEPAGTQSPKSVMIQQDSSRIQHRGPHTSDADPSGSSATMQKRDAENRNAPFSRVATVLDADSAWCSYRYRRGPRLISFPVRRTRSPRPRSRVIGLFCARGRSRARGCPSRTRGCARRSRGSGDLHQAP